MSGLEIVLGVDVGTTQTKALATTLDGRQVGVGARATTWVTTADGGAHIDAGQLLAGTLTACLAAVDDAAATTAATVEVVGIAFTGMAEAGVLLGADGTIEHPVIAWFDARGDAQLTDLPPELTEAFAARTGLPVTPLPTFSKLLWMRHTGTSLVGARWLNVPEYLVYALGGDQITEASLASRTGLLDQDTLTPFHGALELLGASAALLPPLVPAGEPVGRVAGPAAPPALRGAVLTVAGHDHPVASVGAGALGVDQLFDSCGTAEALLRITTRAIGADQRVDLSRDNITQGAHVLPGRRVLLGGTRGGLLLRRTLAMLGADGPDARAALDEACPTGEVTLPVRFEGGRLDDQHVLIHLEGDEVAPALVWRAALDAVGAQATALVARFEEVVGPATQVIAAGGWTRSSSYRAIKRRIFPDVVFSAVEEPGALGAAGFAAHAVARDAHTAAADPTDALAGFLGIGPPAAAPAHPPRPKAAL